jgi:hypothetical protein
VIAVIPLDRMLLSAPALAPAAVGEG